MLDSSSTKRSRLGLFVGTIRKRGGVLIVPHYREMFDTVHPVFLIQVVLCNPLLLEDYVTPRPLIVCIEDNEQHLRLRKAVLEKSGYDVIGVTTAHEALTVLRECPACLVLSDHMLRGTTGAELASKLKKIKMDVPIVVHSGTTPETMKHVDGFVSKDLSTTEFLAFIRDFVRRYCS